MRSIVVFGAAAALAAGYIAFAQPQPPGSTPPAAAQPAENLGVAKAPDGTEMPVVGKKTIAIVCEDIKIGEGAEITTPNCNLTINYHGTLASDGSIFDSTYKDGVAIPVTYPLRQLIPGWQLGLQGMKEGGIRRLTVSPELAYGVRGRPGIPPNATLVFWIEVQKVESMQQRPPQAPGTTGGQPK